ncbi:hypothetical protein HYC85_029368 [Camellia sinensis]|uniref:Uncharacterized protein n=1 Tax=Camellia sinensis TaxID=4442 RepID=A0A7J7FYH3_CAMSI|nr:hypothetical protein HYC85_029368 [Camellia sinensis]
MHVANQTAIKKDTRNLLAIGQDFSHQREDSDEEALDDDSLEAAVMQRMCPRCRLSYKWLKGLPVHGKQYYRDVQRRPKPTNAYNKRPYPAKVRQQPLVVEPAVDRMHAKGKRPLYEIKARDWPPRPASRRIENDHLHRRPESSSKLGVRAKQLPSQPASKVPSKEEKGSATSGSVSSWLPGVPDWFVMQNKPREVPTQRNVGNQGRMVKPPLVVPNNWVLLKHPRTKEPDMVPVISRSQRRKIQCRYTQYQQDLKESGESSSLIQTEGKKNPKSDHTPKPTLQSKVGCSREQLAKVHSKLRVREKASLAGLEKALMESGSETEEEIGMSQKKEMVEEEMFEAFMAKQTFLVKKPVEENHSKEPVSNEVAECSM